MKNAPLLARQSILERQIVLLLRGMHGGPARLSDDAERALADVADVARRSGARIFAIASPFISPDERDILASLAALQRLERCNGDHIDSSDVLVCCATALRNAGILLPHRVLPQLAHGTDRRPTVARYSPIRQKALHFVKAKEVASTADFATIGVSRQMVSILCKAGALQRVGFGLYRSTPRETGNPHLV